MHPQDISTGLTAFTASLVEFVEALTIVLAVGMSRGWKSAVSGTAAGVVLLVALVATLGRTLQSFPLEQLKFIIGILLLLFGMRWLRKAILRGAGVLPLHDEDQAFEKETRALSHREETRGGNWLRDPIAFFSAFKAVVVEGIEVVFVVIATGATGNSMASAVTGASAAGLLVVAIGLIVHRPLARVPENHLKFFVGVLLSAFGVFWVGESLGYSWPSGDLAILVISAAFFTVAALQVRGLSRSPKKLAGEAR